MSELPIYQVVSELKSTVAAHSLTILQAPPGAGKTTVVPLELVNESWLAGKTIMILEPRRLAAVTAASRMAQLLNEPVGRTVGYRVRMDSKISTDTKIEVVTEGILTRRIQNDPELSDVGLIIFDEFHERSINADLGLALSLEIQQVFREDLKIIIMSATLDGQRISAALDNAPVVSSQGRCYPVEQIYLPFDNPRQLTDYMLRAISRAIQENSGSVLAFLPGVSEIKQVERALKASSSFASIDILPLYGDLNQKEQQRAIQPSPDARRKIVLATSIAETSLTIEGVTIVVDSGLRRKPKFDPNTGMSKLETVRVSKSSAEQRSGRAGRLSPGICYRLWSDNVQRSLIEHDLPEIVDAELSNLVLELLQWGAGSFSDLFWLDSPPEPALNEAMSLLRSLDAVDDSDRITVHGTQMLTLGLHPRLAHMIIKGEQLGQAQLACELVAVISERDFIRFKFGDGNCCITTRIEALRQFKKKGETKFNSGTFERRSAQRILELSKLWLRKLKFRHEQESNNDLCGVLVGFAYIDRIAKQRVNSPTRYLLANGRGAHFDHHDVLSASEYIVVANLAGRDKDAKIFLAADLTKKQIIKYFEMHCHKSEFVVWDDQENCIKAREQLLIGDVVLEDKPLRVFDQELAISAIVTVIKERGLTCLPWNRDIIELRARLDFLHRTLPEEWPDVSDQSLLASLEVWIAPYLSGVTHLKHFSKIDLKNALLSLLDWKMQRAIDVLAPTHIKVPAGPNIRLDYSSGNIPVLPVKLQMMFGAVETPTIVNGQVPVLLHLLSPAQRPVQITQDLAGFWSSSYEFVKKDLKGRYPKHDWPDDPLNSKPKVGTRR